MSEFWAYFHFTAHAQKQLYIYELPVKSLTSPFASTNLISCNRGITLLSEHMFAMFWRFL